MKNADRINFYIAGLRQPGTQPTVDAGKNALGQRASDANAVAGQHGEVAADRAAGDTPDVRSAAVNAPEALPGTLTLHSKLPLTVGGQRVAPPDQVQLHRLLVQLNSGR